MKTGGDATSVMDLILKSTQSNSTEMFWTDGQNGSDYATDADTSESTSRDLRGLIGSAVFFALIVLANIISLLAFLLEKKLRTYNNYFIINLTIIDLMVGVGLGTALQHVYLGYYPFSQNACKVITGIFNGIVNASNINVAVICADRHQAVYDPINHFISRTKRKAVIINSLPWVIGLSFWMGYVTVWEFVVNHDNGLHCTQRYLFNPVTNMIQSSFMFYLPLVIIVVLYARIYMKIRKRVGRKNLKKSNNLTDIHLSTGVKNKITGESVSSTSYSGTFTDITEMGIDDNVVASSSSSSLPDENKVRSGGQELSTSPSQRVESTSETKKATRTLLLIVIAFLTAWIPISVINLLYSIEPRLLIPVLSTEAFTVFANLQYGNSLLNPISYALSQPLFRATVIRMFSCRRK